MYSTHQPLIYGVNTYDFCYLFPELSERDYCLLSEEVREEAGTDAVEPEINMKEENEQGDYSEEDCTEKSEEMKEENQETTNEQKTPVSEELEQDKVEMLPEENYGNTTEVTLPTNSNQGTWIDIAPEMEETQIQIEGNTVSVWEAPVVPEDTIYLINGEPYMNGMPADMYYTFAAQEASDNATKIVNYMEALKYASEDEGLYFNLGVCYVNCNDYDNALYYYLQAIEKGDTSGAVDNILDLIEEVGKSESEKELAYRSVLNLLPDDSRVLNKLKSYN